MLRLRSGPQPQILDNRLRNEALRGLRTSISTLHLNTQQERQQTMTKKHFIKIADEIRAHNKLASNPAQNMKPFDIEQLNTLKMAFRDINPRFNAGRWTDYIAGECGPNGGAIKGEISLNEKPNQKEKNRHEISRQHDTAGN